MPLTDDTEALVDGAIPDAMRTPTVNVARGGVVDQSALVAALDVFETEPLPEDSPLWGLEDVVVTPHAAAASRDYVKRVAALVRENRRRLAAGEPLANRVV